MESKFYCSGLVNTYTKKIGISIDLFSGNIVKNFTYRVKDESSDIAEYLALYKSVLLSDKFGFNNVVFYSNNASLIECLNNTELWRSTDKRLIDILNSIKELSTNKKYNFCWIKRDQIKHIRLRAKKEIKDIKDLKPKFLRTPK